MDVKLVNPFVESVNAVFETMLNLHPTRASVKIGQGGSDGKSLTSLVGLSGQVHGVVVLRFPPETALAVAGRMLGAEPSNTNGEVVDAISELVNIIAGSAKAKFEYDPPLQLGLPTVVEGSEYRVKYPSKSVWLEVPFSCEVGDFTLEITFASN